MESILKGRDYFMTEDTAENIKLLAVGDFLSLLLSVCVNHWKLLTPLDNAE